MRPETPAAAAFLDRVDRVEARLAAHAAAVPPEGLTEPDEPSGEQWEAGQVWAHVAEFVPYWIGEAREVIANRGDEAVTFGRTKGDTRRRAAIERDRAQPPAELFGRLRTQLVALRAFLASVHSEAWAVRCVHPTLGEMDVVGLVEEFLVGHLEEHADQLDRLSASGD